MIIPGYSLTATERVLPRLALDFTTGVLDSRVTITRSLNTATRINSSGYIETVNADLPRFSYDPVSLVPKGLLIEESRVNLFSYSSDFSNAVWIKSNVTANSASTTSPDGTLNAYKIVASTTNAGHGIYRDITPTSVTHTLSFYAKAAEYSLVRVADAGNGNFRVSFNLTTGEVVAGSSGGAQYISAKIDPDVNNWYRCSVVFTGTSSIIYPLLTGYPAGATLTNFGVTYAGNNTSGTHFYGVQIEAGAFATSYIPTTTTSLTRNADVVSMTGTNFSDWYNASEGTFACTYTSFGRGSTNRAIALCANNGTTSEVIQIGDVAGSNLGWIQTAAGVQAALASGTYSQGTLYKSILAYKLNSGAFRANGLTGDNDTAMAIPTVDRLSIGYRGDVNTNINGYIANIYYWNNRLLNDEVRAFSKQG